MIKLQDDAIFALEAGAAKQREIELEHEVLKLQAEHLAKDVLILRHKIRELESDHQKKLNQMHDKAVEAKNMEETRKKIKDGITSEYEIKFDSWSYDPRTKAVNQKRR